LAVLECARTWLRPGAPLVISDYCWPRQPFLRLIFARFAPGLVEPQLLREFLDWPLDDILLSMGFSPLRDQRRYWGALRLSAWAAPGPRAPRPLSPEPPGRLESPEYGR
jgi:hypothetical protein